MRRGGEPLPIGFQYLIFLIYRSRALKSLSKLRAAIGLRAAFEKNSLHQNSSLCTVTFGEKVLTLAKSRGSKVRGYDLVNGVSRKLAFDIS